MNTKKIQQMVEPQTKPQTPKPPYPYHEEEVSFENKADGVKLAGSLTLPQPEGPFPVALLINGMGPMDRDATFMGHKRSAVIADHLTRNNIAVLRVDKRGVGKSSGTFNSEITSLDLANDVLAGIDYLKTRKEIAPQHIGLLGHSEGGLIATIVAAKSQDISFIIMMSGSIVTDVEGQIQTTATQLRFDGASETMIAKDSDVRKEILSLAAQEQNTAIAAEKMDNIITNYWAALTEEQKQEAEKLAFAFTLAKKDHLIATFNSPWFRFFFNHDTPATLKKIKIPMLALSGELDFNAPDIAFPIIHEALLEAENKDLTTLSIPKLNHNMQTGVTGSIPEYSTLEETIAPKILDIITEWITQRTINKF